MKILLEILLGWMLTSICFCCLYAFLRHSMFDDEPEARREYLTTFPVGSGVTALGTVTYTMENYATSTFDGNYALDFSKMISIDMGKHSEDES